MLRTNDVMCSDERILQLKHVYTTLPLGMHIGCTSQVGDNAEQYVMRCKIARKKWLWLHG